jgi:hypothetical protein
VAKRIIATLATKRGILLAISTVAAVASAKCGHASGFGFFDG